MIQEISVDRLAELIDAGTPVLDVREPDELAEARVAGVIPIPLAQIEARLSEIPEGELAVICRSGGRSMQACETLAATGRTPLNVAGGTLAWIDSGRPVESD